MVADICMVDIIVVVIITIMDEDIDLDIIITTGTDTITVVVTEHSQDVTVIIETKVNITDIENRLVT